MCDENGAPPPSDGPPLPTEPPDPPPLEEKLASRARYDTRPEEVLASRTIGVPLSARDDDKTAWSRKTIDSHLSKDDWATVYKAYEHSGNASDLAKLTGLSKPAIHHLLHYGIQRLGLRSIREAATDFAEVARRSEELLGEAERCRALASKEKETLIRHMPDVEQAITDRAVRETAAAQGAMLTCVRATDVMLGYVNKLLEHVTINEDGYEIPEQISAGRLESMAKAVSALANATAKAIEQSRLAAGEPTQHVAVQVAGFVSQLSPEELRRYVETRELPSHLLLRGGSRDRDDHAEGTTGISSLPVVEAEVVDSARVQVAGDEDDNED